MFQAHPLARLIPSSNILSLPAVRSLVSPIKATVLEAAYSVEGQFLGTFCDTEEFPDWARRIARYNKESFLKDTPGKLKQFSDIATILGATAVDKRCLNFRHALEFWAKAGKINVMPFSEQQDYGSCVDASFAALVTALLGYRAAHPELGWSEEFVYAVAWYLYAMRGYCGDGWDGWSIAAAARRYGIALRKDYGNGVNFTDDDTNEQLVARTWCRSGIPQWMLDISTKEHPFEDGAITEFNGDTPADMMAIYAAGGCLHFGGTNTSGSSRPFVVGRVGGHQQTSYGCDGTEEYRKFAQDVIGEKLADDDFAIVNDQTWGSGWSGECSDKYWPSFWGPKPQGAWVWRAKQLLQYFKGDIMAYLPKVKGIPSVNPPPPPPPPPGPSGSNPVISGNLYLELDGKKYKYIVTPAADL